MILSPGDDFGRYTVLAFVGQGGMGVVYRAHDRHLDRVVALKVLRAEENAAEKETGAARLLREGRAAAAISHPNAVAIFDVGEWNGTPFMAMELVEGETLRAHVGDPRDPVGRRVKWLVQIASALAAAHKRGVVHRDVKPDNVIVGNDGNVRVLDFGIARRAPAGVPMTSGAPIAQESTVFGSPRYMAPEQLQGGPLDGRVDQFAWGVLAFELLTGRHPWETARTDVELAKQILGRAVERPSRWGAPEGLDEVVRRTTCKGAEHRFASMEDVIAELRAAVPAVGDAEGEPEERSPSGPRRAAADLRRIVRSITTRTFAMNAGSGAPRASASHFGEIMLRTRKA